MRSPSFSRACSPLTQDFLFLESAFASKDGIGTQTLALQTNLNVSAASHFVHALYGRGSDL